MAGGIYFWNTCATQQLVNPGTVPANSTSNITVSLPGLLPSDIILTVVKPTYTAGLDVGAAISSTGSATVLFQNSTAAGITPGAEQYKFVIYRAENAPGTQDGLSNGAVLFK
jgi:hypothetical protein